MNTQEYENRGVILWFKISRESFCTFASLCCLNYGITVKSTYILPVDPCAGFLYELEGIKRKYVPLTGVPFCDASCLVDNGGCGEKELCLPGPSYCDGADMPCYTV